jgi:hypothetical protein
VFRLTTCIVKRTKSERKTHKIDMRLSLSHAIIRFYPLGRLVFFDFHMAVTFLIISSSIICLCNEELLYLPIREICNRARFVEQTPCIYEQHICIYECHERSIKDSLFSSRPLIYQRFAEGESHHLTVRIYVAIYRISGPFIYTPDILRYAGLSQISTFFYKTQWFVQFA